MTMRSKAAAKMSYEERKELFERVVEIFEAESKLYRRPGDSACHGIVTDVLTIRTNAKAPHYGRPDLVKARKTGKAFLTALEALTVVSPALDLEDMCLQVRRALRWLGEPRDEVKFLAERARAAWATSNDGIWPKSLEADKSPLVAVVAKLFVLTNIEPGGFSLSYISKILKGERRQGRR